MAVVFHRVPLDLGRPGRPRRASRAPLQPRRSVQSLRSLRGRAVRVNTFVSAGYAVFRDRDAAS
jgi:hypothetical protein